MAAIVGDDHVHAERLDAELSRPLPARRERPARFDPWLRRDEDGAAVIVRLQLRDGRYRISLV